MAKMVRLTRDGRKIEINADQIQWLEQNPSNRGTIIHFMNGDQMDVEEEPQSVSSQINQPS